MARYTGAVRFPDKSLLYFVYDGTVDVARARLYPERELADAAWNDKSGPTAMEVAADDEEVVSVMPYFCHDDPSVAFMSRASRTQLLITGPRDLESASESRVDYW